MKRPFSFASLLILFVLHSSVLTSQNLRVFPNQNDTTVYQSFEPGIFFLLKHRMVTKLIRMELLKKEEKKTIEINVNELTSGKYFVVLYMADHKSLSGSFIKE